MTENHELCNIDDQIKLLKQELELSEKNELMFKRLQKKWSKSSEDIRKALIRLHNKKKIKNTPQ